MRRKMLRLYKTSFLLCPKQTVKIVRIKSAPTVGNWKFDLFSLNLHL